MLVYKAWLESKFRFFAGLAVVISVCTLYIRLRPILIPGWISDLQNPHWSGRPRWLYLGVHDLNFYAWHFLYENKLQQAWVLFAILLAFGGLARERQMGTSAFSLGLPVTRSRWFLTRMFVAAAESQLLALAAVIVVRFASWSIHEPYGAAQILAHCLLIAVAGVVFVALGAISSTLIRGEHMALPATLVLLGIPYLFIQEYFREAAPNEWISWIDISHVMAGPPQLTWVTVPWFGVAFSLLLTACLSFIAIRIGQSLEY